MVSSQVNSLLKNVSGKWPGGFNLLRHNDLRAVMAINLTALSSGKIQPPESIDYKMGWSIQNCDSIGGADFDNRQFQSPSAAAQKKPWLLGFAASVGG
jgi:hypothetical protein